MDHQILEFNVGRRGMPVDGELCREVIISTEKPVRSGGGIARAAGAVLTAYMRNPVVMWAHGYREPPVARATGLTVEPGVGISARFEFPAPGVYPLADTERGLWDGGFINAASIGFMPLEWEMIEDPEAPAVQTPNSRAEKIPEFRKWELYEFSLVSVPRDREALRRAMECLTPAAALVERELKVAGIVDGEQERRALAAAVGSLPALDLQRMLDGLRAVRRAYHA
jgi:hypothetical protein